MDKFLLGVLSVLLVVLLVKGQWIATLFGFFGLLQTARIIELLEKYKHD